VVYSPDLQRTPLATEAQYLLARYVFETLGYRRYEWKCNVLHDGSCRAARRLGFTFEGVHRQLAIAKGRNRDTAWFSMLDGEWPARKANFERWLAPENFTADGEQKVSLSALNGAAE
jgi:RimJ/RimL family protein N-acetyltransferase